MKNTILSIVLALITSSLLAQQRDVYEVKSGTEVNRLIPYSERFLYPAFTTGQVRYRNGQTTQAKLNYSLVHGEIMFVDFRKDTLLLTDHNRIDYLFIGKDLFYYYPKYGHFFIKEDFGNVKLGKKEMLVRMGEEKYSAYGQYSSTSAITNYSTLVKGNGDMQFLNGNNKILLRKRTLFFFVDQNNRFYTATRYNLLKLFSRHKREVNAFLKEHEIMFNKEADLNKTLEFCSRL